ncbi:peptidase S9 [Pedobacter lusitanus]|uniref:Peptidase S9 n=1 Tax=Pedobacter lusitanus TaxID=1503925 RepID=A0A0D0GPV9_9SPHI|nr:DPP IV N-terminal domain-containing protein [Pedobacter lusitanus]KIO76556.1 peptidase S9 [Pedobacter lusitanus]
MKKLVLFLLLLSATIIVNGQQKSLSMLDAMSKIRTTLAPEKLENLQFLYGTEDYVYTKIVGGEKVWFKGSSAQKEDQPFLTLTQLNQKLSSAGQETLQAMPAITFNKSKEWLLTVKGSLLAYDPVKNTFAVLMDSKLAGQDKAERSIAGYTAYLDHYNLFVNDGKTAKQVTNDGTGNIVYASSVHRDEFGISKGTFWSNNGKQLAFYRMDQSMVADYPIIDWTTRPAKNVNIKYPMAGDKIHEVTVGVYNTQTQTVIYLKTGEPAEQYLTNIAWSPDDKFVYIAVLNRGQNQMELKQFDAQTGNYIKTLFEERDEKYVEPLVPVFFLKNDPQQFIWQSNRDGWNHLYLYNTAGKLIKQLTKGKWEVTEVKGFDATGDNLFYESTEESPITRNLYAVNIKSGKSTRVTTGFATHKTEVSTSGNTVIDYFSTTKNPGTTELITVKKGLKKQLLQAADPLKDYQLGESSIFTIKGKQGDLIYCNLFKPVGLDSTKKHPVVVYWYGGSHAQLIHEQWNGGAGNYWFQYLAEQGFVVMVIDTRGSDNRGKAFEQSMFRRAGDVQMEDMMSAVGYLKGLSYTDEKNMGLFGWSFGGFNTVDFMINHPGVFKAAVAGGAVTNWNFYEAMYTERYMDTPKENPDGYAATDLTSNIQKLKGKLLLIHGLQDNVVLQQHTVELVKKAVDNNVQVDYMIYPGHEHNVIGKDRTHLYQKVTDYFMQNLK